MELRSAGPLTARNNLSEQSTIQVGCTAQAVWIRVDGKGSFQNSPGMKEFAREMVNRGYRYFVIDLDHCPVMDSTFMGTMAGIALRLREIGQGGVTVVNLNERNTDLLCNLGLDQIFEIEAAENSENAPAPSRTLAQQSGDKTEQARTMLEAHEALVAADGDNETKFKDVLEYLKQDLHGSR